jgi:hypothetical protein
MKQITKQRAIILLATVLSAAAVSAQSGYLSEIKMAFTDQMAQLPASPIFTAGPYDGDYLVCVYLASPTDTLGASLAWADENGNARSQVMVAAGTASTGSCTPIRNLANTAPTVKTTGSFSAEYSLFVVGFGFWKVGPEKQGGITEPISGSYPAQTSNLGQQVVLYPDNNYETYLVAMNIVPYSSLDDVTVTLEWYDEGGWKLTTLRGCSGCLNNLVIPIRSMNHTVVTVWTEGTVHDKFDLYVRGLEFGTPAVGSGPVAFYGQSFLDWVNPVSYNAGEVPAGMWVMAANGEYATAVSGPLFLTGYPIAVSNEGGVYPTGIAAAYQPNAASESFSTLCGSYECLQYSAEFNLLVF